MADEQLNQQVTEQVEEQYPLVDSPEPSSNGSAEKLENRLRLAELAIADAHRIITQRDTDLAATQRKLENLSGLLQAKEQSLAFQRAKIAKLLIESERIAAEREDLASFERRLLQLSPNAHAALAELLAWRQLGLERLGTCFNSADRRLEQLQKYAEEMGSPGHRIVRFFDKTFGRTWVGRKWNAVLHLGYALLKAR